jgi:hypothetical protein
VQFPDDPEKREYILTSIDKSDYADCALGADVENVASAVSEQKLHKSRKALSVGCGNKRLNGARKSAAVNTASARNAHACKIFLCQLKCQRKSLLLNVFGGVYVLEELEGGVSGLLDQLEEGFKIVILESLGLYQNSLVFVDEVKRSQNGTVTAVQTYRRHGCDKIVFGYFSEGGLSEEFCNLLHFRRHGGIILVEICVISAGINDAKSIARLGQIELDAFDLGLRGILEIDGDESADCASKLIHKSAGLAEEFVFGKLGDGRNLNVGHLLLAKSAQNVTHHYLKGSR